MLGITIAPPQTVRQLGLEGILVLEAPTGSPANQAGIKGTFRYSLGSYSDSHLGIHLFTSVFTVQTLVCGISMIEPPHPTAFEDRLAVLQHVV